jgi:ribose transport system substrate-binding protein
MKKSLTILVVVLLLVVFTTTLAFAQAKKPKRVGWCGNYMMHEWYQNVQKGMKARAEELGITLEIGDSQQDMARQVSLAEDFIAKGVDVLIVTPVQQEGAEAIVKKAKAEGVPLVIEASSVKGMTTMVAICDYDCGYKGGVETGKYVKAKLGGKARILARISHTAATILEQVPSDESI